MFRHTRFHGIIYKSTNDCRRLGYEDVLLHGVGVLEKQFRQRRQVDLNYEPHRKIRIVNHSDELVEVAANQDLRVNGVWRLTDCKT